jgi:O-antigen ligase
LIEAPNIGTQNIGMQTRVPKNGSQAAQEISRDFRNHPATQKDPLRGAFFWLSAFYLVYCSRPEDWIPGMRYLPLAKITGIFAVLGLISSWGKTQRKFKDLPRESFYLLALIGVLIPSALFSPIWRGGALLRTLDFAKVYLAFVLTFLLVTTFKRLRRIIFIQAASVVVVSVVSIVLGHSKPRLQGVIGGIYSNPNDLAFAVVLSVPFCLAFLLTSKNFLMKLAWLAGMLIMGLTLFMTASRGGFVTLVVAGTVALWHFGVRGRRLGLIVGSGFTVVLLLVVAGGPLMKRMKAIEGGASAEGTGATSAYESYEERKFLMVKALHGIVEHPLLGLGVRNFSVYSGVWADVHMTYLQIAVEGGIPSLILYLMFFSRGFRNLRQLRRRKDLDMHTRLLVGGLHSSMVGFVIGALFAPEAYQFFPYFAVAYTSTLVATIAEQERDAEPLREESRMRRFGVVGGDRRPEVVTLVR